MDRRQIPQNHIIINVQVSRKGKIPVRAGSKPAQYSGIKMNQEPMGYSEPKSKTRTGLEPAPTIKTRRQN